MREIQDRFVSFLMMQLYHSLKEELVRLGVSLSKALEEDKLKDADRYMEWIKDTRGMIDALSDENMTPRDFMGMILGKYGAGE